jgi:hypothetical protein
MHVKSSEEPLESNQMCILIHKRNQPYETDIRIGTLNSHPRLFGVILLWESFFIYIWLMYSDVWMSNATRNSYKCSSNVIAGLALIRSRNHKLCWPIGSIRRPKRAPNVLVRDSSSARWHAVSYCFCFHPHYRTVHRLLKCTCSIGNRHTSHDMWFFFMCALTLHVFSLEQSCKPESATTLTNTHISICMNA